MPPKKKGKGKKKARQLPQVGPEDEIPVVEDNPVGSTSELRASSATRSEADLKGADNGGFQDDPKDVAETAEGKEQAEAVTQEQPKRRALAGEGGAKTNPGDPQEGPGAEEPRPEDPERIEEVPSQFEPEAYVEAMEKGLDITEDGDKGGDGGTASNKDAEEGKDVDDDDAAEEMVVKLDEGENVRVTTTTTTTIMGDEYDNADPKDFGIEVESDDEYNYLPPSNEDLPNLENLMGTLEEGDSELHTEREPPTLFNRPEHEPSYRQISHLRQEMEEEPIDPYIDRFEDNIRDDVLMIGNISLEEVQEEERRLRDEHIAYQQQEAQLARKRQEDILFKEEKAKRHVTDVMKEKRKELAKREELSLQRERLLQDQLHKSFKKAENLLKRSLEIRKGEVKTMFGDLMMADGQYGGSKGRRWKVDWNRAPQPIQIKLKCLRGVKDKLPAGRFVLMTALYDRLGGHVLRWSNLRGQEWGGATLPLNHDGHFYNVEMTIDQSLFTVCPSKPDIRPGMVLVFELFLLRGTLLPVDKVVAWGVFPICDGQFEVLQGKYKAPMLRGEMDTRIELHESIEKLMASDLDHWLCNVYFEIVRLPRYMAGQKEYEVELQFSSNLMGFPDRTKGAEEAIDGEEPIQGSQADMASANGDNQSADIKGSKVSFGLGSDSGEGTVLGGTSSTGSIKAGTSSSQASVKNDDDDVDSLKQTASEASTKTPEEVDGVRFRGSKGREPPPTTVGSRKLLGKYEKAYLDSESESDDNDEDYIKKKEDGFRAVKGEPGLFYKQHLNPPQTDYLRRLYTMIPKTTLLNQRKKRKKLTHLEELATHGFAVQEPFSTKGHTQRKGHEKVQYISRQLFAELGLSQWRSREFWTLILLLCVVFFMRMYLHYLGQWAFLNIISVPISQFQFLSYTVSLNYQASLLQTNEEVAVVILGPLTNVVVLSLLVFICWLFQRLVGNFPDLFCKFVIVYAIMTLLDPYLIAIIDAPLGRYSNADSEVPIADAAKLYYHFYRIHDNGLMGILLTVPIILFLSFFTCVIFYMYFLRLHNNGRMLDIYHRLHAAEADFFIPFDLEISNQELAYICNRAEQWRGEEGERRKVAVYDYIWEEDEGEDVYDEDNAGDGEKEKNILEITTHVSLHTIHLDGLRELFRHFLRLPDGSIVEVFGEMGVVGLDKDLRAALQNQTTGLEKWAGSVESINALGLNRAGLERMRPKTVGGIGSQDLLNIPGTPSPGMARKGDAALGSNARLQVSSQASLGVPHNLAAASTASSDEYQM
ncbi:uncharacterized protein [Diadema setosum]|uniref:uncharacterized protein n=1 Tax=Diadema setosum TaxID=31175 RepID=UPI003B3AA32A